MRVQEHLVIARVVVDDRSVAFEDVQDHLVHAAGRDHDHRRGSGVALGSGVPLTVVMFEDSAAAAIAASPAPEDGARASPRLRHETLRQACMCWPQNAFPAVQIWYDLSPGRRLSGMPTRRRRPSTES
jgi:hypothetical protein